MPNIEIADYDPTWSGLAVTAGAGPRDYAAGKTELIQEMTDRARHRLGPPSVPVREK